MKVFIENEAGSLEKNIFDEKTLEYKKTNKVSAPYPFPYGFVIGTTSGDGDNLDCFVLTHQPIKSRQIIEVEPIGMYEQVEDGEQDNKILAVLKGEGFVIDENLQNIFREFTSKVFSHKADKTISVGRFLGVKEAQKLVEDCQDK